MAAKNLDRLLIKPYEKKGAALHVEQTVQTLINDQESIEEILHESDARLYEYFPNTVTGNYKRETRRRQVGTGAIGHLATQQALPRLIETYQATGSLAPPDTIPDSYFNYSKDSPSWDNLPLAVIESYRMGYELLKSYEEVQNLSKEPSHVLHPLYKYWTSSFYEYGKAFEHWKQGPGKNRWPTKRTLLAPDKFILSSMNTNVQLSVNLMASKAIHHLLHNEPNASAQTLSTVASEAIDHLHWATSTDRHLAWEPDWKDEKEKRGFYKKGHPHDGAAALLQLPASNVTESNRFAASIDGVCQMGNPDFIFHEAVRDGPVEASAACGGNVFYRPTTENRVIARRFFETLGFNPENGDCYSLAGITLAIGHVALRTSLLPAFDENRRKEGLFIAGQ